MFLEITAPVSGIFLVFVAFRDVWQTLFDTRGRGQLNHVLMGLAWQVLALPGRRRPELLGAAGPVGFLLVVGMWVGLVAAGFALIYWAYMPEAFSIDGPTTGSDFWRSVYFSLVTLGTVGYGDIVPEEGWTKLVAPIEGITGFVLLTAAIAWLTSLYPALGRRRALVNEATSLRRALKYECTRGNPAVLSVPLQHYAALIEMNTADSQQSPAMHYWAGSVQERYALIEALGTLRAMAIETQSHKDATGTQKLHASLLLEALEDFAGSIQSRFLRGGGEDFHSIVQALGRRYAIQQSI